MLLMVTFQSENRPSMPLCRPLPPCDFNRIHFRNEEVSGSIPLGSTNRQFPAESPFRCLQSNALLASLLNVRLK